MSLDPYTLVLDGFDLKAAGMGLLEVNGIDGGADHDLDTSERWGDGTHTGLQRLTSRTLELTIGHNADTDADAMKTLRRAMNPRTNRQAQRLARFRLEEVEPTKRFLYVPSPGRFLSVPGDPDFLGPNRFAKAIVARAFLRDPYLYSDDTTVTDFGTGGTETIVNDGDLTATSVSSDQLGAMSWSITSGGCTDPFLQHEDYDEAWILPGTFAAGEVITVDSARVTRVDLAPRHRTAGPDGAPCAIWPALRPGDNDITIGCASGAITSATLTTRSVW